jgi:hypothetical protein
MLHSTFRAQTIALFLVLAVLCDPSSVGAQRPRPAGNRALTPRFNWPRTYQYHTSVRRPAVRNRVEKEAPETEYVAGVERLKRLQDMMKPTNELSGIIRAPARSGTYAQSSDAADRLAINSALRRPLVGGNQQQLPMLLNLLPRTESAYRRVFPDSTYNARAAQDTRLAEGLSQYRGPIRVRSPEGKIEAALAETLAEIEAEIKRCFGSTTIVIVGHAVGTGPEQYIRSPSGNDIPVLKLAEMAHRYGMVPVLLTCDSLTLGTGKITIPIACESFQSAFGPAAASSTYSVGEFTESLERNIRTKGRSDCVVRIGVYTIAGELAAYVCLQSLSDDD